jgi:hypothetical protein
MKKEMKKEIKKEKEMKKTYLHVLNLVARYFTSHSVGCLHQDLGCNEVFSAKHR